MIYFGYCTLLDVEEMGKYCPTAQPIGVARLLGYRPCFATYSAGSVQGGCNLEEAPGHEMWGLLYELTPEALDALDAVAGVDQGYYKKIDVTVTGKDGKPTPAMTYVIPQPGGPFRPAAAYTRPILIGARALELPKEYIAQLDKIVASVQQH